MKPCFEEGEHSKTAAHFNSSLDITFELMYLHHILLDFYFETICTKFSHVLTCDRMKSNDL